jgi:hypothetical protein
MRMYRDAANGAGPSVAQANYSQALNQQQAVQASAANSARGGGLARSAAMQTALGNSAAMGQQSAAGMAALRAQEIATARGGYAGVATNMRGQDVAQQGQDAGQAQYLSSLALNNRNANDAQNNFYENKSEHVGDMQFQGQMNHAQAVGNTYAADNAQQSINNQASAASADRDLRVAGAATSTVGTVIGAASDERVKHDIHPADDKMRAFLDALQAHDYKYNDPGAPGQSPGHHVSPMAQELEKSDAGRRLVENTPSGKMVNYGPEAMATAFAAMASLNKRLRAVEGAR